MIPLHCRDYFEMSKASAPSELYEPRACSNMMGDMMTRRIRIVLAILATWIASTAVAAAQTWPAKPLRAFIPFAAGSATDLVPRAVFEPLAAELGQPIVVENRGGAG